MASSENTWAGVEALARKAGSTYPELVAAQWALESGWGKHFSGAWNAFGLKGEGSAKTTTEYVNGKRITITAEFIDFPDLGTCVQYLVDRWYKDWEKYKGVNRAANREAAARQLVAEGYATDPGYAGKLITLMREHALAAPAKIRSQSGSRKSKPVLFRLEATQDTWLKKRPEQADGLGEGEKVLVPKGKGYAVCAYTECPRDAHAQVELGGGAGTWFVFEPHWRKVHASGEALPASVDWADFSCLVTPHVTVGEVLRYDSRRRPQAGSGDEARILRMAGEFERVRGAWGGPIGITSWYRPEPYNQQVGGVPGSQHVRGLAVDVYPVGRSLESFYQWIRVRWTGGLGDGRHRGFIHLDLDGGGAGFVPGAGVRPRRDWRY